jgi:acyl carrier protein
MNRVHVFHGVRECLADVLDIAPDAIKMDQTLLDELGVDSLDLLDLTFRLERKFKIRISLKEIGRATQARLGDVPLEIDGVYTPEGLAELRRAMPEVPPSELAEGLTPELLPRRFRVATMVGLVSTLMEEQGSGPEMDDDAE